jgi:hypothetical protein
VSVTSSSFGEAISGTEPSSGFADFVICRLRYARIQTQIALNEINTVRVALTAGLVDVEDAVAMLHEAGLDFILTGASTHE